MKLLINLIFLVFFFFAFVQEIGARPYPEDSTASTGWISWFSTSSSDYGEDPSVDTKILTSSDISEERADLLTQGTTLANQVLELVGIVPGLESVSNYGKEGVKMAENLGKNAMGVVNTFQENLIQNFFNLDSQFPMIANGRETIKSGVEAVLAIIQYVIDGITNLSSVGDSILSSLHQTRQHISGVNYYFP